MCRQEDISDLIDYVAWLRGERARLLASSSSGGGGGGDLASSFGETRFDFHLAAELAGLCVRIPMFLYLFSLCGPE